MGMCYVINCFYCVVRELMYLFDEERCQFEKIRAAL